MPAVQCTSIHLNLGVALVAWWRQVLLETVLAIQIALLLDKSDVLQWTTAFLTDAHKVVGAPDFTKRRYERSSVNTKHIESCTSSLIS